MTKQERRLIALALLTARPPVIPGTRVIPDDTARKVWYDCVTGVADVCCRGEGDAQDRRNAQFFFDTAGVPE